MVKNSGKISETEFKRKMSKQRCFIHRFYDGSDIMKIVGPFKKTKSPINHQPSDFIVVHKGETYFAEVKSFEKKQDLFFSRLSSNQRKLAFKITSSGGTYKIFVHYLSTNEWYCVPFEVLAKKKKLSLDELTHYEWVN